MAKSCSDLEAQLVHQYLKAKGYKALAVKLAKKLNLDTSRSGSPHLRLEDMCQGESDKSDPASVVGLLVYNFLKAGGHADSAEKLAEILHLDLKKDLQGLTLERVCHAYQRASSATEKAVPEMDLSTPKSPVFKITKSTRGGPILHFKDHEYYRQSSHPNGRIYWRCRFNSHSKCKNCPGKITVHWATGEIVSFNEHSHAPGVAKQESSMGTDDTTVRYSMSRTKTPVLHYRGYAYLRDGKQLVKSTTIRWGCRQRAQKKCPCPGFLYLSKGQVVEKVREHNHLPSDLKPHVTEEETRMLSPLFL